LDILVNNAGISQQSRVEHTTIEEWNRVMDINAIGVFLGTKTVIPAMRRASGGSIINIFPLCWMLLCEEAAHGLRTPSGQHEPEGTPGMRDVVTDHDRLIAALHQREIDWPAPSDAYGAPVPDTLLIASLAAHHDLRPRQALIGLFWLHGVRLNHGEQRTSSRPPISARASPLSKPV
jgi:hypothetical protein